MIRAPAREQSRCASGPSSKNVGQAYWREPERRQQWRQHGYSVTRGRGELHAMHRGQSGGLSIAEQTRVFFIGLSKRCHQMGHSKRTTSTAKRITRQAPCGDILSVITSTRRFGLAAASRPPKVGLRIESNETSDASSRRQAQMGHCTAAAGFVFPGPLRCARRD